MLTVWTISLIAYDVEQRLNISVSYDTVSRALKDLGYSYKRPSKTVPSTAPGREEKLAVIKEITRDVKKITSDKKSVIYALDESHFSTEPYLVKGWFKKKAAIGYQPPQKGKASRSLDA